MKPIKELTTKQAVIRALEWRVVAILVDFLVSLLLTGQVVVALGIASVSNVIKTIVHALWIKYRGHD